MKLEIMVSVQGYHGEYRAGKIIPELEQVEFRNHDVCDDFYLRLANPSGCVSEVEYEKIMVVRKDAADILARELSELIVKSMSDGDTRNGYKIVVER